MDGGVYNVRNSTDSFSTLTNILYEEHEKQRLAPTISSQRCKFGKEITMLVPGLRLALVVPTLNEGNNIGFLLTSLQEALQPVSLPWEVIVVDDDSSDATPEIVQEHSRRDCRIRLVTRRGERGLAGAILDGWALSGAELLGVMDADLQHPPNLLPSLVEAIEHADIAIASRYCHKHGVDGWNPVRTAISRLSTLASLPLLRHLRVTDPMSGFFIVRRQCLEGIVFQSQGFKLLLEILVRGRIRTAKEVPYSFGTRHAGTSKASASVALRYLQLLGRLSIDSLRGSHPE